MNFQKKEAKILNLNKKAQILYETESTIESLLLFQRAELILKDFPVVKLQLLTYNNMASYYLKQNNYELSMEYLSYCSKLNPTDLSSFTFQIGSLINLSSLKSRMNRHKEAISTAFKALNLLEDYPNECLLITCYYTITLEYYYLSQIKTSEEYFDKGYRASLKYFGSEHWITYLFVDIKNLVRDGGPAFNEICIIGDLKHARRSSLGYASIRKVSVTDKKTEEIKINTTPWLEHDNWKIDCIDERFYPKSMKISPVPDISKSLILNNDILAKLDRALKKSKIVEKRGENWERGGRERIAAAVKIQRAFRKYLKVNSRKKFSNKNTEEKFRLFKIENNRFRTKSELRGKNQKVKYQMFDAKIKGFRKGDLSLF